MSFKNILTPPFRINAKDKYMIISPHPDDETFGCGNLIAQIKRCGGHVRVLFLSKGEKSCAIDDEKLKKMRMRLAAEANQMLGNDDIAFLDWADGNFVENGNDTALCAQLKESILDYSPNVVLYPHIYDNTNDHRAASRIIQNLLVGSGIRQIMYCVWLWDDTPWTELLRLKYSDALVMKCSDNQKLQAVNHYATYEQDGVKISGNLPVLFLKMMRQKRELYFKVNF